MVYARSVRFELQQGKNQDFRTLFDKEILPLLRKQEGFRDEMILLRENVGLGISLWNDRESIDKYNTRVFPEITKKLTPLLKGQPTVEVYEVTSGTINLN